MKKTFDKKFLYRLKNDGVFFAEKMLGYRLHDYQEEIMRTDHKYLAICWSRQLGKTTVMSIKATHYAITNPNKLIIIISQDRERAREFYNLIIGHIHSSPILSSMIKGEPKQSETVLANGTRIINKAAGRDGKSLRGYSANLLIIDEADFIPEKVFVAAEQCVSATRGSIWLISTPYVKGSLFYRYFQDGMEARRKFNDPSLLEDGEEPYEKPVGRRYGFMAFHKDWKDGVKAIKPNGETQLEYEFVMKKKKSMQKWQFEQEYLAKWSDDISAYFNETQIKRCVNYEYKPEDYIYHKMYKEQIVYVGIDFAKHKDKTVMIAIGRLPNGRYKVLFTFEMSGRDWDKQIIEINTIMKDLDPTEIIVDQTGLGDVMLDILNNSLYLPNGDRNFMMGKIEGVSMSSKMKVNLYTNLQNVIGNMLIELPNHKPMIDELIYLQYDKTNISEYVSIHAPETSGMHDDYPDALALACYKLKDEIQYFPVSAQSIQKLVNNNGIEVYNRTQMVIEKRNEQKINYQDSFRNKRNSYQRGRRSYKRSGFRKTHF